MVSHVHTRNDRKEKMTLSLSQFFFLSLPFFFPSCLLLMQGKTQRGIEQNKNLKLHVIIDITNNIT